MSKKLLLAFTLFFGSVLYFLGCGSVDFEDDLSSLEISQSESFKEMVMINVSVAGKVAENVRGMSEKDVKKFKEEFDRQIEIVDKKQLGFENLEDFYQFEEQLDEHKVQFLDDYPGFRSLAKSERESLIKQATFKVLNGQKNKGTELVINVKNEITTEQLDIPNPKSCENEGAANACLEEAFDDFAWSTAGCVAGGLFNILAGSACQAVNILHYESKKQNCISDNC